MGDLGPQARAIWDDAMATTWGRDNGASFYQRIAALEDPSERIRLCQMLMDRQHASLLTLQQLVYDTWRQELPHGESPVEHRAGYTALVDGGEDFRRRFADLVSGVGTDAERAELLTLLVVDGSRWLAELREHRDEAIIEALASGFSPRQLAGRLRMSKTQIVNVRHRYLRDLESVGASSREIVYRSHAGVITYVNDAYRAVTGIDPTEVVGRPVESIGHPDDQAVVLPQRDEAVRRGHGRFQRRLRLRTASGGWCWVDADFSVITNPDTGAAEVHAHARPAPDADAAN